MSCSSHRKNRQFGSERICKIDDVLASNSERLDGTNEEEANAIQPQSHVRCSPKQLGATVTAVMIYSILGENVGHEVFKASLNYPVDEKTTNVIPSRRNIYYTF